MVAARTLEWSGYQWNVRTSNGSKQGPGPNVFDDSTDCVFVDEEGLLHLKIIQNKQGIWTAAEVSLAKSLSFGTYVWEVASRYDQYGENTVAGLFTYLSPERVAAQTKGDVGNDIADTPHEIDIEFTKAWGKGHLYFTTHDPDVKSPSKNFYQPLEGDYTTHQFKWEPARIGWKSFHGHVAEIENPPYPILEQRPGKDLNNPAEHVYEGPVVPEDLDEVPIINLWLFGDNVSEEGPSDGKPQELILKSFHYTPLESNTTDPK